MSTMQQLSTNDEWGSTVWSCNHMKGIVDCTVYYDPEMFIIGQLESPDC